MPLRKSGQIRHAGPTLGHVQRAEDGDTPDSPQEVRLCGSLWHVIGWRGGRNVIVELRAWKELELVRHEDRGRLVPSLRHTLKGTPDVLYGRFRIREPRQQRLHLLVRKPK